MSIYAFLLISIALSVASQLMQKYVALNNPDPKQLLLTPLFWLAMISLGLSMLFWTVVLSVMDVGQAYPMLSANYVLMLFFSWFLFKEVIPPRRIVGVIMIVAGVFIMGAN